MSLYWLALSETNYHLDNNLPLLFPPCEDKSVIFEQLLHCRSCQKELTDQAYPRLIVHPEEWGQADSEAAEARAVHQPSWATVGPFVVGVSGTLRLLHKKRPLLKWCQSWLSTTLTSHPPWGCSSLTDRQPPLHLLCGRPTFCLSEQIVAATSEQQHPFHKAAHNSIVGDCAQGVSRVVDLFCLKLGSISLIEFVSQPWIFSRHLESLGVLSIETGK